VRAIAHHVRAKLKKLATCAGATCAALLGLAAEAQAQTGYFYLDRAQISGAPDDGFMVWRPQAHEVTRFYGFTALGYTLNPLRSETVTDNGELELQMSNPVQGQVIQYLHAGAEIAGRLGLNVSLPVTWLKDAGTDPQGLGVGQGGIEDYPIAIHDVRFDARLVAFESDNRRVRIGLGGALWAPTGNSIAFTSDEGVTGYVYGAGEVNFGKFFLAGNIGPHFRPERTIGGPEGTLGTDTELRYAFGAYLPLRDDRYRVGVELWGTTGLAPAPGDKNTFFASSNTDIEWLGQGRMWIDQKQRVWAMGGIGTRLYTGYGAPDLRVLLSIGIYTTLKDMEPGSPPPAIKIMPDVDDYDRDTDKDGYPDSVDKCVNDPEDGKRPNPTDGCPAAADRDNDGIPDSADQCPDEPEDKDGIEDKDGCPETDADSDQIPDAQDKCPTEPGPRSQIAEKNGCPLIKAGDDEIAILEPIEFEFGKAVIKPVSYPILDEVVKLMKARPKMRIGVYGHTDNRGAMALNMRLSKERARACMNYLSSHGIAANRLESEGFGPNKPVADNGTDEGRARNRRVEFKILSE
jgi:outer membrane protein OmpA-like peptidoglycan-associated protein